MKSEKIKQVAQDLQTKQIVDVLMRACSVRRVIGMSLLGGISRGIGFTLGATLILVILFRILLAVARLNIPYLQDFVQDMVNVIATTPAVEKIVAHENMDKK